MSSPSMRIPIPRANPSSFSMEELASTRVRKVPPISRAHREMTGPASLMALSMASSLFIPLILFSRILVVMNIS